MAPTVASSKIVTLRRFPTPTRANREDTTPQDRYPRSVPGSDDLDDLIDRYVADAMRATGVPAEHRAKPSPSSAPPLEPEHAEPVPVRTKAPTPTGVARLAAELFDDLVDDVAPPPRPPPAPAGVSIRFSQSQPIPLEPPEPALSELYTMPLLPGLVEEPPSDVPSRGVPETLPGMGPPQLNPPGTAFATEDPPTDPDAGVLALERDDEPTNVVTRPQP